LKQNFTLNTAKGELRTLSNIKTSILKLLEELRNSANNCSIKGRVADILEYVYGSYIAPFQDAPEVEWAIRALECKHLLFDEDGRLCCGYGDGSIGFCEPLTCPKARRSKLQP